MIEMIECPTPVSGVVKDRSFASRVLIVDDEPNVRLVFRTALESSGYEVDEARTGLQAIDAQEHHPADVVLLDLQMPGMGGMEVLRRLRLAGSEVPVVIVTAHGSVPDAVAAMKLGAIDFLSKPLTPDALRSVVADVIKRHKPAPPEPRDKTSASLTARADIALLPPAIDFLPIKLALNRCEFDRAHSLLEEALDLAPESSEALTLMGVLFEVQGRYHSAYQAYKEALQLDPTFEPALENMRRYCGQFGLDFTSKAINPAASG